jgi:hypothetical protein
VTPSFAGSTATTELVGEIDRFLSAALARRIPGGDTIKTE